MEVALRDTGPSTARAVSRFNPVSESPVHIAQARHDSLNKSAHNAAQRVASTCNRPHFQKMRAPPMHHKSNQLELFTETLERRQMLAGNVTVTQSSNGGVLVLGDSADNLLLFSISDGDVAVSGINTTVNGQNDFVPISDGLTFNGNLTIRTRGGDDYVMFDQIAINGKTRVETGAGDDEFVALFASFDGETQIRTAGGIDQMTFDGVNSSAEVVLNSGAGGDVMSLSSVQWTGGMTANLGAGDDYLLVNQSNVEMFTEIQGGGGDDYVELSGFSSQGDENQGIRVSLNSGDDQLRIDEFGYLDGDLTVTTAGGDDLISVHSLGMQGDASFNTGGGSDVVAVVNTTNIDVMDVNLGAGDDGFWFGCAHAVDGTIQSGGGADLLLLGGEMETLALETAGGADTVLLNRFAAINSMSMNLGGQSDQLFVSRLSILPDATTVNGGAGSDTVQWDSDLDWQVPLTSFETNPEPAPLDDVILGGIFVFATAWSEHGGVDSELLCS